MPAFVWLIVILGYFDLTFFQIDSYIKQKSEDMSSTNSLMQLNWYKKCKLWHARPAGYAKLAVFC